MNFPGTYREKCGGIHLLCDVLQQQHDLCWAIGVIRQLTAMCRKLGLIGPSESLSIQYAINTIAKHFKDEKNGGLKGLDCLIPLLLEDGIVLEEVVPLTWSLNEPNPDYQTIVTKIKIRDVIVHNRRDQDAFQFESDLASYLSQHPVCAAVPNYNSSKDFFKFGTGIYSPTPDEVANFDHTSAGPGYHIMLLSGADDKSDVKFWELQGSYGDRYGAGGFCYVAMFRGCIGYFLELKNPYMVREPLIVKKPRLEIFDHVSYDKILYKCYIEANKAHATMLNQKELLSDKDASSVLYTLDRMKGALMVNRFPPKTHIDDVRGNIDGHLYDAIKDVEKSFNVARYGPELFSTTYKLLCRAAIDFILFKIKELQVDLIELAGKNAHVVVPIRCCYSTDDEVKRRVLLSHVLLTFVEQVERDVVSYSNCRERHNLCPLGAGYMCGSKLPNDTSMITAKALNFTGPMTNSIDAISDRSFLLEFLQINTNMVIHLSALKDLWVQWLSSGFVTLPHSDSIHESFSPQVLSSQNAAQNLCSAGLPFAFSQDFGQFKEHLFVSVRSTIAIIDICLTFKDSSFFRENIKKHIPDRLHNVYKALVQYLVNKEMPRARATAIVDSLNESCDMSKPCDMNEMDLQDQLKNDLQDLSLDELRKGSDMFEEDVFELDAFADSIHKFHSYGSAGETCVTDQLRGWIAKLDKLKKDRSS